MSTFSDIEEWVKDQLETEVTALTSVKAIAEPEEFQIVGRNAPAAGVLVVAGDATDQMTFSGDQLITVDVGIWVSSRTFRGGEDLSADNGLHELFDSIHTAFKAQTPTSAFDPLRYIGHRLEDIADGLAVMVVQYRTQAII
jgi:hypothetical protein